MTSKPAGVIVSVAFASALSSSCGGGDGEASRAPRSAQTHPDTYSETVAEVDRMMEEGGAPEFVAQFGRRDVRFTPGDATTASRAHVNLLEIVVGNELYLPRFRESLVDAGTTRCTMKGFHDDVEIDYADDHRNGHEGDFHDVSEINYRSRYGGGYIGDGSDGYGTRLRPLTGELSVKDEAGPFGTFLERDDWFSRYYEFAPLERSGLTGDAIFDVPVIVSDIGPVAVSASEPLVIDGLPIGADGALPPDAVITWQPPRGNETTVDVALRSPDDPATPEYDTLLIACRTPDTGRFFLPDHILSRIPRGIVRLHPSIDRRQVTIERSGSTVIVTQSISRAERKP